MVVVGRRGMYRRAPMDPHALIDLYVPASTGSLEEAARAAAAGRVDAIVYVADSPEELPDPDEVAAVAEAEGTVPVHLGTVALGPGYRFLVLLPADASEAVHGALEVLDDPVAVQAAVAEAGGCAVPVSPRQDPDGEVMRTRARLAKAPPVGVVAVVAGGSSLGRDLDVEDASAAGRRILGGTGPFGDLQAVGRFASVLPADPNDLDSIVDALNKGLGAAVELLAPRSGEGGGQKRKRKRKRNRRRRGKGSGGENQGGSHAKGDGGGGRE